MLIKLFCDMRSKRIEEHKDSTVFSTIDVTCCRNIVNEGHKSSNSCVELHCLNVLSNLFDGLVH